MYKFIIKKKDIWYEVYSIYEIPPDKRGFLIPSIVTNWVGAFTTREQAEAVVNNLTEQYKEQ